MNNLTAKEKALLAAAGVALVLIGIEVGKRLTLTILKKKFDAARGTATGTSDAAPDAAPAAGGGPQGGHSD